MRIAVITESFLPRVNGVTNSVCRVLEQFAAHGHQALVVAAKPGPEQYAGHEVAAVGGFALPGYRSFVVGLPTARLVKRLREFQPDVVYLASPISLGWAGAAAARRLGIPCVAVFQTDVAGFARRYGLRGTDKVIWSWLRRIHAQADLTLVPSTATMRLLEARGFPRLALWRRGVDAERFHPRYRDELLRYEVAPERQTVVGYVGRLAPEKRVDLLAHLSGLPGIRLVVVGEGPAEGRLRAALPGATFTGFLDGLELSRAYASLDVFVHTGADETFCQSVQEAMSSGVPVVAPAAGGPLDLVTPGRTGLLYEPDSIYELRAAVMRLSVNRDLRALYGLNARAEVENRTWGAVGAELMRHLETVVGARSRSVTDEALITTTIEANAAAGRGAAASGGTAAKTVAGAEPAARTKTAIGAKSGRAAKAARVGKTASGTESAGKAAAAGKFASGTESAGAAEAKAAAGAKSAPPARTATGAAPLSATGAATPTDLETAA